MTKALRDIMTDAAIQMRGLLGRSRHRQSAILGSLMLINMGASALAAPDIIGTWRTSDGATVQIQPCGKSPCGKLVDFKPLPGHSTASATDVNHKDKSKRTRKLQGLTVLWRLKPTRTAWNGRIYDPRRGFSADVTLTSKTRNTLTLRGCVRVVFKMCETEKWRRLP
ncbi:DUF2147 domain-containing protein [Roseibium algae]|uniref:DUF2147 domain-containing protein n=1 Tax=Roseibium algae TaxID=3123038 RepID=A0ABU8TQP4_9HYPH